ncbi:MAG: minichromosome maintenance protein MCM [Promethearchaeota archaeon]
MSEISEEYIEQFKTFFKEFRDDEGSFKWRDRIERMPLEESRSLIIDFNDVRVFDPALAELAEETPERFINAASTAVKNVMKGIDPDYYSKVDRFHARFRNPPEKLALRKIRAVHIGKFVQVEGILTRASEVKPLLIIARFVCINKNCGYIYDIPQDKGYTEPPFCENPTCGKKGSFKLKVEESTFTDWQKIRIQEMPEELPPGQLPRSLDVIIKDDLVDIARPGDRVGIIGILRSVPDFTRGRLKTPTYSVFLESNYVDVFEKGLGKIEITPEEEQEIKTLSTDVWIHQKLIRSIAPSIYGYENIKEAIALLLFGGSSKVLPDGMKLRGESNILLVGDPGTAKSQLLQYVARISPRALYTSGKGSTAAGLTAAVLRDTDTGEMTLEAGALVLSDMGVACIDEFDKMRPEDRVAIHEAMEQHTISIAKAGIVATLNARTSILAAANPSLGRYNSYKTPAENIKLPVTILSRFDLMFVLQDKPEEELDRAIAAHILKLHKKSDEEIEAPISPTLLRKYIAYAKQRIHPRLTPEAAEKIEDFYLKLRKAGESANAPVPITARQLEALVRLSESRAKMALRGEVSIEDAEATIRLMQYSLQQVGVDESGRFDIDSIMLGQTKSTRDKIGELLDLIRALEHEMDGAVPISKLINRAEEAGFEPPFVKRAIDNLQQNGEIYEPKSGFIKRITSA